MDAQVLETGSQRWHELEVELVDDDPQLLARVDEIMLEAGARRSASPSKLARAPGGPHGAVFSSRRHKAFTGTTP